MLSISRAGADGARSSRGRSRSSAGSACRSPRRSTRSRTRSCGCSASAPATSRRSTRSEDLKAIISQSAFGGELDPGEAGMLSGVFHFHEQQVREVMTPIPAVVTVDASEDVESALRRCISSGHTRLVVIEDDNPDRVRGDRPHQQPRAPPHERRRRRLDRAGDPARAGVPRDETARRPAGRAPAAAQLDGRRRRRVRAHGRDRHRRGRARGGRRRDRGRDRPARRVDPPARRRRLVRARPRLARRSGGRPASSCRSTPTRSTRSAATSSPSSGACRSAATRSEPTATRSASSRSARTGSSPCGSARRRAAPSSATAPEPNPALSSRCVPSVFVRSLRDNSATEGGQRVGRQAHRQAARGTESATALGGSSRPGAPALARGPGARPLGRPPRRAAPVDRRLVRGPHARASPRPTSSGTSAAATRSRPPRSRRRSRAEEGPAKKSSA